MSSYQQQETKVTLTEKILEHAKDLPESLQAEVLDFVEYLESKTQKERIGENKRDRADFSLMSAMRGMEDEPTPYTIDDLKERFT